MILDTLSSPRDGLQPGTSPPGQGLLAGHDHWSHVATPGAISSPGPRKHPEHAQNAVLWDCRRVPRDAAHRDDSHRERSDRPRPPSPARSGRGGHVAGRSSASTCRPRLRARRAAPASASWSPASSDDGTGYTRPLASPQMRAPSPCTLRATQHGRAGSASRRGFTAAPSGFRCSSRLPRAFVDRVFGKKSENRTKSLCARPLQAGFLRFQRETCKWHSPGFEPESIAWEARI